MSNRSNLYKMSNQFATYTLASNSPFLINHGDSFSTNNQVSDFYRNQDKTFDVRTPHDSYDMLSRRGAPCHPQARGALSNPMGEALSTFSPPPPPRPFRVRGPSPPPDDKPTSSDTKTSKKKTQWYLAETLKKEHPA